MKKISIIVPIYNSEKYLEKCLNSLILQTLEDIEIILINDASPDNSKIIMEEYKKKYPNKIKCIYLKKNLSQGGARNEGLKIAQGEYITFVDSDDYIDVSMCEQMYREAKNTGSDIVFCDIYREYEETGRKKQSSLVYKQQTGKLNKEKREQLLLLEGYPVAKIIWKNIIFDHNLWFPEHIKYEDRATVNLYYAYTNRSSYIRKPLYTYVSHKNSTTTKVGKQYIDYMNASKILYKRMIERRIHDTYPDSVDMALIKGNLCAMGMQRAWENFDLKEIYDMSINLKKIFPNMENNRFYNLDYDIDTWKGKIVFKETNCSFEEFSGKSHSMISLLKQTGYGDYYLHFKEKIIILADYLQGKKTALWGAGKKGKDFLETCDRNMKFISFVIDKDESKSGQKLTTGHEIVSFQKHVNDLNVILVANNAHFGDIYNQVKTQNDKIAVINLDAFIAMGSEKNIVDFIE